MAGQNPSCNQRTVDKRDEEPQSAEDQVPVQPAQPAQPTQPSSPSSSSTSDNGAGTPKPAQLAPSPIPSPVPARSEALPTHSNRASSSSGDDDAQPRALRLALIGLHLPLSSESNRSGTRRPPTSPASPSQDSDGENADHSPSTPSSEPTRGPAARRVLPLHAVLERRPDQERDMNTLSSPEHTPLSPVEEELASPASTTSTECHAASSPVYSFVSESDSDGGSRRRRRRVPRGSAGR